jgi:hypothetical protein
MHHNVKLANFLEFPATATAERKPLKPVRAGIFADGHFKTNQTPFRSGIGAKGINATAQGKAHQ